jgi:hypothetical protein
MSRGLEMKRHKAWHFFSSRCRAGQDVFIYNVPKRLNNFAPCCGYVIVSACSPRNERERHHPEYVPEMNSTKMVFYCKKVAIPKLLSIPKSQSHRHRSQDTFASGVVVLESGATEIRGYRVLEPYGLESRDTMEDSNNASESNVHICYGQASVRMPKAPVRSLNILAEYFKLSFHEETNTPGCSRIARLSRGASGFLLTLLYQYFCLCS